MNNTFDPEKDYLLEDNYALLRPLKSGDFELLKNFGINEPELWKFSLQNAGTEEGMREYLKAAMEKRKKGTSYSFIVFDKTKNEYAGSTRLYDIDVASRNLSLGYTWYGKNFQGTGLNKHCKYLLFEFIFEQMEFERVEFRLDSENERSMQAIKSLGCTFEGVLRNNGYRTDGTRRNSAVLSMLKSEWLESKKELLKNKLI
ncbi:GNAT family N-acetyltransferase [Pedobacter steynii]|uniref:GNAT family N-acetyltransferase n=1 Tax=Pedobacter steynii TaxID=430522 RepID=A0A1D7QIE3_9SPHI|nr:GNAT family N-acetyltransferase [Pedobacter steynii]AOM78444.1 GNAT family N-acetyltransferase [Pedobacter steynii]